MTYRVDERIAEAKALRGDGLKPQEIADAMGAALRTVYYWLNAGAPKTKACGTCGTDLTSTHGRRKFCSERCRKAQYDLACTDCGGRIDGTTPGKLAAEPRCVACAAAARRIWTRETILQWIRDYAAEHGIAPASSLMSYRRHQVVGPCPYVAIVMECFPNGGWRQALREAGFTPYRDKVVPKMGGEHPVVQEMIRLYRDEHWSVAEIAEHQGVTNSAIYQRLERYGVRPYTRQAAA